MCFGIPVKSDMSHFGVGNELQYSGDHTESRAQNRHNPDRAAGDHLTMRGRNRSFDVYVFEGKIFRRLIGFQHGDFFRQLHELLCSGVLVAQKRKFMLDERVVYQMKSGVVEKLVFFHKYCIS